jgi:hypothetical protein
MDKREMERILATEVYFLKRTAGQTIADRITNDGIRRHMEL